MWHTLKQTGGAGTPVVGASTGPRVSQVSLKTTSQQASPSLPPLNINTEIQQVNQLSNSVQNSEKTLVMSNVGSTTKKTVVKRIVVRKKKVKKKKKKIKGTEIDNTELPES